MFFFLWGISIQDIAPMEVENVERHPATSLLLSSTLSPKVPLLRDGKLETLALW